jgi:pyruvate/2-oxoglutarate dehydrogenase complex dihydrolipoamide acyltransferase (E2) component
LIKEVIPFPPSRRLEIPALDIAVKRHIVNCLLEADVTVPRRMLKETSGSDGRTFSFTAFVMASYARAIHAHPLLQAYRLFPNKLIVFHNVDVSTFIEHRSGGMVVPHVIRNADTRSVREISEEIRATMRSQHLWGNLEKGYKIMYHLPRFIHNWVYRGLTLNPNWITRFAGTTQLSSFGMLGRHMGWSLGLLYGHTFGLWVGGIKKKPMVHKGKTAIREYLHLAVSVDHDIVDAEPVALFLDTFIELLERGAVLEKET